MTTAQGGRLRASASHESDRFDFAPDVPTLEGMKKSPLVGAELTALLLKNRASNAELVVKLGMKKEGAK